MLDAFIIDKMKKAEEEEEQKQDLLPLTLPSEHEPEPTTAENPRKPITIKF
jgi:hypothetical protein